MLLWLSMLTAYQGVCLQHSRGLSTHPVIELDDLLALLHRHQGLVFGKQLHRLLNARQQLPRPHDVACCGWHIVRHGRVVLLCLVLCLHSLQVPCIVQEDYLQQETDNLAR
jgi:hypothetical protein